MENKVQVKQRLTVGMPRGFGDLGIGIFVT